MRIGIPDNFQGIPELNAQVYGAAAAAGGPIPTSQDLYKDKSYQWMGTDNVGLVDVVERTIIQGNKQIVMFKSGRQIPVDELNRLLRPVDQEGQDIRQRGLKFEGTPEEANFYESLRTAENMPNKVIVEPQQTAVAEQNVAKPITINKTNLADPIESILSKRKENIVDINCELKIDIPKSSLVSMLLEDFDTSKENIFKLIVNETLMESIKNQIFEILDKHYEN